MRSRATQTDPRRKSARTAQPRRPPDYWSRGEQWRLLVLVSMLMLVVVLMSEAAKPASWYWLWGGAGAFRSGQAGENQATDTRLPDVPRPDRPVDAFVAVPAAPADTARRSDEPGKELPLGVQRQWLAAIEDNTVLRAAESPAWFGMLRILANTDTQALERASLGPVAFVPLLRQTSHYRGQLVTVSGTVRRALRIDAVENDLGITHYWQCWLRPTGATSPIVVYTLHLPERFPTGSDVREPASFTGFCYKRWAYLAADGTRVAPLLLAKTARWQPALPPRASWWPAPQVTLVAVSGVAVLAILVAVWVYRSTRFPTPFLPTSRDAISPDTWKAMAESDKGPATGGRLTRPAFVPRVAVVDGPGGDRHRPPKPIEPPQDLGRGATQSGG